VCALVYAHSHTVSSHSRGHYQTFGRRDAKWYLFDDRRVSWVAESLVAQQRAYVLFYTRRPAGGSSPYALRRTVRTRAASPDEGIQSDVENSI
jgi:hypothetical protein